MFALYKRLLPELGGYLTHAGELNRGRLEAFMRHLADAEADVLHARAEVGAALPHGCRRRRRRTSPLRAAGDRPSAGPSALCLDTRAARASTCPHDFLFFRVLGFF